MEIEFLWLYRISIRFLLYFLRVLLLYFWPLTGTESLRFHILPFLPEAAFFSLLFQDVAFSVLIFGAFFSVL
jgi:hypothetical protein